MVGVSKHDDGANPRDSLGDAVGGHLFDQLGHEGFGDGWCLRIADKLGDVAIRAGAVARQQNANKAIRHANGFAVCSHDEVFAGLGCGHQLKAVADFWEELDGDVVWAAWVAAGGVEMLHVKILGARSGLRAITS